MRIVTAIFILLLIMMGTTFALLNATPVEVSYYIGAKSIPLSLLLISLLIFGVVIGLLISLSALLRLKFSNRRLCRKITLLEKNSNQK